MGAVPQIPRFPIFLTLIATAQENYMHIISRQNYTSHTSIKGVLAPPLARLTNPTQNVKKFPLKNGSQFQIACWPKIGKSGPVWGNLCKLFCCYLKEDYTFFRPISEISKWITDNSGQFQKFPNEFQLIQVNFR